MKCRNTFEICRGISRKCFLQRLAEFVQSQCATICRVLFWSFRIQGYIWVLCLFVSFCYRAALPVATELFASVNFFWLYNALMRKCYLGYATLLTGSAM